MRKTLVVRGVVGVLAALGTLGAFAAEPAAEKPVEKFVIRHKPREGEKLRYSLSVGGNAAWTPEQQGLSWANVSTDFTFTLAAKALREDGTCTFGLEGEKLKTEGKTHKGSFSGTATPTRAKLRIGQVEIINPEMSPLKKPMSMTFNPRWMLIDQSGLEAIAIFFAVGVDPRFWGPLTIAPLDQVGVGDEWQAEFPWHIPDSKGQPLKIKAAAKVTGWETYRGLKCLAGTLTADLSLQDTWVTLNNGDRIRIVQGTYKAKGKVLWDVARGVLCYASAENTVAIRADKPDRRTFNGTAHTTLQLLGSE